MHQISILWIEMNDDENYFAHFFTDESFCLGIQYFTIKRNS